MYESLEHIFSLSGIYASTLGHPCQGPIVRRDSSNTIPIVYYIYYRALERQNIISMNVVDNCVDEKTAQKEDMTLQLLLPHCQK